MRFDPARRDEIKSFVAMVANDPRALTSDYDCPTRMNDISADDF
jgi:hypothetical protein